MKIRHIASYIFIATPQCNSTTWQNHLSQLKFVNTNPNIFHPKHITLLMIIPLLII